ncbi:MAG: hypothetical protein AAFO63_13825 [Pseudomonadota bacterium]
MAFKLTGQSSVLITLGVLFTVGAVARFVPDPTARAEDVPQTAAARAAATSVEAAPQSLPQILPGLRHLFGKTDLAQAG